MGPQSPIYLARRRHHRRLGRRFCLLLWRRLRKLARASRLSQRGWREVHPKSRFVLNCKELLLLAMEHKSFQDQAAWTFCLADEKNHAVSNFVRFHSNDFGGCVEMMVAVAAVSFFAGVIIIFVIILHFFDTYVSQRYRRRHRAIVRPFRVVAPTQVNLFVYKASHRHWLGDSGEVVKCTVCQSTIVEGNIVRLLNYFDEQEAPPPPKPAPAGWDASIATPFQPAVTSIGWGTWKQFLKSPDRTKGFTIISLVVMMTL
ncbi:hypothetical protein LOK49_Contig103G00007 [Camellia lanceoleosa]|nr:hypothetical protein LOK49_Contig103G00007 [Camellia lanceoleosa]